MSNEHSMHTNMIEDINDITSQLEQHGGGGFTPMCKGSFSTDRIRNDSYIDINPNSAAALKNRRLVTILKEKIFKGFSKLKQKKIIEEEPIIAINSRVWKVTKKGAKKKKQMSLKETIRSSTHLGATENFMEIKKMETTLGLSKEDSFDENKMLFITEKPKVQKIKKVKLPTEEEKREMLLKQILNNNLEEGKFYNLLNFKPFEIKRPTMNTHYNNNRLRLENEMIEHANEEMAKTSKSEFLFKISRPIKDDPTDTSKNLNFMTNPGFMSSIKKYQHLMSKKNYEEGDEGPFIGAAIHERDITFSGGVGGVGPRKFTNEADNHIDRMRKIVNLRESVNKKLNQEKIRQNFLKRCIVSEKQDFRKLKDIVLMKSWEKYSDIQKARGNSRHECQ
jgi:hypothetical protein